MRIAVKISGVALLGMLAFLACVILTSFLRARKDFVYIEGANVRFFGRDDRNSLNVESNSKLLNRMAVQEIVPAQGLTVIRYQEYEPTKLFELHSEHFMKLSIVVDSDLLNRTDPIQIFEDKFQALMVRGDPRRAHLAHTLKSEKGWIKIVRLSDTKIGVSFNIDMVSTDPARCDKDSVQTSGIAERVATSELSPWFGGRASPLVQARP